MSPNGVNVDPQEIHKFSQVADDWWNPNGDMKALHQINPLRIKFIAEQIQLSNQKVLDVGCGGGILTESLAKAGAQASGIDLAEKSINVAQAHAKEHNLAIHYEVISVEALAEQSPASFDVITCLEMLEHVPNPASVIKACSQLVKPGGHLFFSTLARSLKSYLLAVVGAEYILNLIPRGTHDYHKFINPSELQRMCRAEDIHFQKTIGINYNPFTGTYCLVNDISVNYLVYSQKNA